MKVWLKTSKQQILTMKTKLSRNQSIFFSYSLKAPCFTMIQWSSSPTIFLNKKGTNIFATWGCRNPSLGLATKVRVYNGVGQEGSLGVTSQAPWSVGECERMNPHTPKWAPTLGVGLRMDSRIFRELLQGSKPIGLKSSLYHRKALGT